MRLQFKAETAEKLLKPEAVLFLYEEDTVDFKTRPELDCFHKLLALKDSEFKGEYLNSLSVRTSNEAQARWVFLVGLGSKDKIDSKKIIEASAKASALVNEKKLGEAIFYLPPCEKFKFEETLELMAVGSILGLYKQKAFKTDKNAEQSLKKLFFNLSPELGKIKENKILSEAQILAEAQINAREWSNQPPNICYPESFAQEANRIAAENNLKITILDEKAAAKKSMGAFLAVGCGSARPPRMVIIEYNGLDKKTSPVVLIGKGITFDSGGLCLKPADSMIGMKTDMSGAANVLAIIEAAAKLEMSVNLVAILPLAENMPGGKAYRPGDVLTSMSGKTIEVINTDAEGRLVLADAITLAGSYKPSAIIDMATLTGACVVALGLKYAGLFTDYGSLRHQFLDAGDASGERFWPLPLAAEYEEDLKSETADFSHVATSYGGAINAALFLKKFIAEKTPWIHIDIAGPSRATKPQPSTPIGATGFAVRSTLKFLKDFK